MMDGELLRSVWPIFAAEAREHLEQMSAGILELERDPSAREPGRLVAIKRIAHTLKGSAASIGLEHVERLVHAIEDSLSGEEAQTRLSRSAVDVFLRAIAQVESLLERVPAGGVQEIEDLDELLAAIHSTKDGGAVPSPAVAAARPGLAAAVTPTALMDTALVADLWPVFREEAREHLALLRDAVTRLGREAWGARSPALRDQALQWIRSLRNLGATLGVASLDDAGDALEAMVEGLPGTTAEGLAGPLGELAAQVEAVDAAVLGPQTPDEPPGMVARLLGALPRLVASGGEPDPVHVQHVVRTVDALGAWGQQSKSAPVVELAQKLRTQVAEMALGGPNFARSAATAAGVLIELEAAVARAVATAAPASAPVPAPENPSEKQASASQQNAPTGGAAPAAAKGQDRIIRVSATTVDTLSLQMDQLVHFVAREERRARDLSGVMKDAGEALLASERMTSELRQLGFEIPEAMGEAVGRLRELQKELRRISRESQRDSEQLRLMSSVVRDDLRDLRMVPASFVLEPLRRTVRDVATRVGKEVELEIHGGDVKLDRRILDAVKDPLLHLIRNAVDHGLETPEVRTSRGKRVTGKLAVTVSQLGARILIEVEDDGAGLSLERIRASAVRKGLLSEQEAAALNDDETARLIFRAGFSTAEKVTAISGRGVGLDVVHDTVTRLQGTVDLSSTSGKGTCFKLDLPLTLAVKLGLLVQAGGEPCAVPNDAVERLVRLSGKDLGTLAGQLVVTIDGEHVPFTSLAEVIGLPRRPLAIDSGDMQAAIVVAVGAQRVALAVDAVLGQQEVVVHPLGPHLAEVTHLAGATVLDSGKVVAVLNAAELIRIARGAARTRDVKQRSRILVADDALTTRSAMKYLLEIAGLQVITASDGEEALALLRETPCQMLVCDVRMPRMDGLTLCREVKSDPKLSKLPVVLVTSLDSAEDRAAGLHAGADGYLVKREVERGGLLDLVRQLLGGE